MLCEKTLIKAAGTGYLVKLCPPAAESDAAYTVKASRVSLVAGSECYVQFVYYDGSGTAPAAPSVIFATASDQKPAVHLAAGQPFNRGTLGQTNNPYTHLRVWAVAAGELLVDAE